MISINAAGLVDQLKNLGLIGWLVLTIVALQQGWVVFGREVKAWQVERAALIKDRDEWKALAMSSMHAAERTVTVAATVLPRPEISAS